MIYMSLCIYVLSHEDDVLARVPNKYFIQEVALHKLPCDVFQDNRLAEFRFYVGLDYKRPFPPLADYVGVMTARWDEKYSHKVMRLETMNSLSFDPETVWVSHIDKPQWERWISQFDGEKIIREIEEYNGLKRKHDANFIWSGNYICHRRVYREIANFLNDNINWIYEKYGLDVPFEHPDEAERKRNFAFLMESVLILYLQNRTDLMFKEIR